MQLPFSPTQYHDPIVALGTNEVASGRTMVQTLREATSSIQRYAGRIASKSQIFRTPSFPPGTGPDYANAALTLADPPEPYTLLAILHDIETSFGRIRSERWGPRTLDLDLIAYDDCVLPDRETFEHWRRLSPDAQRASSPRQLIVPHPRMHERAFVLVPVAQIAPGWRHPVLGQTSEALLSALDQDDISVIGDL